VTRRRVVHYLNQFFGGQGGEEQANMRPSSRPVAVGPGLALQKALGEEGTIVGTVICGDNFATEREDEALAEILRLIAELQPDLVVAGPAFNAGRYGMACGAVAVRVGEDLRVPAVTGMYPENAGVPLYQQRAYIVPTGPTAARMAQEMQKIAALGLKLVRGEPIGPANADGYLPRGFRKNGFAELTSAARAVNMLLAKIEGQPFETEIPLPAFDRVAPPAAVPALESAVVALVSEGGIVPCGNPDRIESGWAKHWARYSIADLGDLTPERFESIHGGYDIEFANADPDRIVPLDVMRQAERLGRIGKLHDYFYSTSGMACHIADATRMGEEIAQKLLDENVNAVVVSST
jgi:glycine reductase complex component B subunit gamma